MMDVSELLMAEVCHVKRFEWLLDIHRFLNGAAKEFGLALARCYLDFY